MSKVSQHLKNKRKPCQRQFCKIAMFWAFGATKSFRRLAGTSFLPPCNVHLNSEITLNHPNQPPRLLTPPSGLRRQQLVAKASMCRFSLQLATPYLICWWARLFNLMKWSDLMSWTLSSSGQVLAAFDANLCVIIGASTSLSPELSILSPPPGALLCLSGPYSGSSLFTGCPDAPPE